MLKYDEFCSKFCEIENRYNLFGLEFKGVQYWKYARYYVYNLMATNLFSCSVHFEPNNEEWKLGRYNHKYQRFTDYLFHNVNIGRKKDILLFTFGRRVKEGRKYVSPITDEISLHLKRSHCIVETPAYGGYYRPTPVRWIKYFDVWQGVGEESKVRPVLSRGQLRKQLLSIFEQELGVTFTREQKKNLLIFLNYYIMYHDELVENYKRVIAKVSPKLVIVTSSYIGDRVVLTEVLKEMGITSVEILHGYIDDNCYAYNYAEIGINPALPDYIFAYSQIQKDMVHWGIAKDHVRVVGHPNVEKKAGQFLPARKRKGDRKVITFISSANRSIEKYIVWLAKNLNHKEYEIVFKLHPEEYFLWQQIYQNLPEGIRIVDNNENDIHYYLANADYVVGITSTALFEATLYPVDIFVIKEESYQSMKILLEAKEAVLVSSGEELLAHIERESDHQRRRHSNLFERNAIVNINNEIQNIIDEN